MIPMKQLVSHCRKMPHATEDIKWETNLVFSIGGKMFAVFDNEKLQNFSCKVDPVEFPRLINMPGISPAPYLARHHWVYMQRDANLPTAFLKELLSESYQLVLEKLPRSVQAKLKGGK